MRRTILMLAVVSVVLVTTAQPAIAAPPVFTHEQVTSTGPVGVSCSGFDINEDATADHYWTDFYANDGTWVRSILRFTFSGTLSNSTDPAKTVPYVGRGVWTFLPPNGDGSAVYNYSATIDGHPVRLASGLAYWDMKTGEYLWHGLLNWDVACTALA